MTYHDPGCVLDPVTWLRHAIAAARKTTDPTDDGADRLTAASLLNAMEHFTRQDAWRTVTLLDIVHYASPMHGRSVHLCTCGGRKGRPPLPPSRGW